ncbi:inosine-uridine preferring nucleoside hydrolase [Ligilactobacillus salitolerans]|uniref:Inosine-uridine preferring nucleoside hydrolase n=1 Tax=Ligilactobacillus salitolerans TaxID=1808352 RepID=A0A401IRR8_9LACO|nr:pyrimidine-specific ribonucleoside hydrolase RihA [Ligilactobacillus salitolerans]GBG94233.1 inosine-uridine preferring nucleoside hydrolase [Ligilactobacillus salitolerans]
MTKIILDCDPGHDDAFAIMMAVAAPEIEVAAVTTSAGNQTPDKTLNNALRMLTLLRQTNIPVAGGNQKPLLQDLMIAESVHGSTGLDGTELPEPGFAPQKQTAVELIAQTLRESEEKVTLVVTGPMTNAALFLSVYPDLKEKIEQIVFMGGAKGFGNWSPAAEFNIAVDPEAAKIVVDSGIPLVMAGLNVTHQAQILKEDIEAIRTIGNPVAVAMAELLDFYGLYYGQEKWGFKGIPVHDPVTITWLLHPEYFTTLKKNVDIELNGKLTRGETVVDQWNLTDKPENTTILMDIDREKFVETIKTSLHAFD